MLFQTLLVPFLGAILFVELLTAQTPPSTYPALPSETPAKFAPVTE